MYRMFYDKLKSTQVFSDSSLQTVANDEKTLDMNSAHEGLENHNE